MTRVTPNTSSIFFNIQNSAAAPASDRPGTTQHDSAVPSVALGKRPAWFANVLESQTKRAKAGDTGSKDEIKKVIVRWLEAENEKACASLIEHICGKTDASDGGSAAQRKTVVEKLVSGWRDSAQRIQNINRNDLGAQRELIMTRLLVKIVQPPAVTFKQACTALSTVCVLSSAIEYLAGQAQAICGELEDTVDPSPKGRRDTFSRMALAALHEDLVSNGYKSADVIDIAERNFSGLLLLASDVMNQPPIKSGNARNNLTGSDPVSMDRTANIARSVGSITTVFTMLERFPMLEKCGYSADHALNMARQVRGSNIINAVLKNHAKLIQKEFTIEHIATIAASLCGNVAIERAVDHFDEFKKLGFDHGQIVRIVKRGSGGFRPVQLTLQYAPALLEKRWSTDEIVRAVRAENAEQEIEPFLRKQAGTEGVNAEEETTVAESVRNNTPVAEAAGDPPSMTAVGAHGAAQSWTDPELAFLGQLLETRPEDHDAVAHQAETIIAPISHAAAADVGALEAVLRDENMQAALLDPESLPFW